MRNILIVLAIIFFSMEVSAQDEAYPHDGSWQNSYCVNPRVPFSVRRDPTEAKVDVLFDISAEGRPSNVRLTNYEINHARAEQFAAAFERSIKTTLKRWEYFAYIKDGVEAPRTDVALSFFFLLEENIDPNLHRDDACTTSALPDKPSHAGDLLDPLVNISYCTAPSIPPHADRRKISGQATINFQVDKKGRIREAMVTNVDDPNGFAQASLRALKQWRYTPYLKKGEPVERPKMKLTFYFGKPKEDIKEARCVHGAFGTSNQSSKVKFIRKKPAPRRPGKKAH